MFLVVLSAIIVGFLVNQLIKWINGYLTLPPGPFGYPILGYAPKFFNGDVFANIDRLHRQYGPIFTFSIGSQNVVMLDNWSLIKDALASPVVLDRPENFLPKGFFRGQSFVEMNGNEWRQQRRTAVHLMKDLGFGKSQMEEHVSQEVAYFIKTIETMSREGKPIGLKEIFNSSVFNNTSSLLFCERFDYDDPELKKIFYMLKMTNESIVLLGSSFFDSQWINKLLAKFRLFNYHKLEEAIIGLTAFSTGKVQEHVDTYKEGEIRDYIDGYLAKHYEVIKNNDGDAGLYNLENLQRNVFLFFAAGNDTVVSTMLWLIIHLVKNPQYQKLIQAEIDTHIGDMEPKFSHRNKMPLTMATIYETQRINSIISLNLMRALNAPLKLGNYTIPAKTSILMNFHRVHNDEKLWKDPSKFNPQRFINIDGNPHLPEFFIPFSSGKRDCPGRSFAYLEIFLYLVYILKKFDLVESNDEPVSLDYKFNIVLAPKNDPKIILKPRVK